MKRLALLSALVLAACAEKKTPPPPAPAPKADIEPVLDAAVPDWPGWPLPAGQPVTAAMICRGFLSPSSDLHDKCARQYDPHESTRDYLHSTLKECVPRVERSLVNGRAEINQAEALNCLAKRMEFRRSGRTDIYGTEWEHACDAVFIGKAAPGTQCREDWECTPGYACAFPRSAQVPRSSQIGKCTTPATLNGPCASDDLHLAPSHVCSPDTYCAADTCRRRDQEGEGCGPYSCAAGTFCSTGLHKCVKALAVAGANCSRHDDCAVGLYCDVKRCAPQKNAGAKCLDSIECRGDCERGVCIGRCN